MTVAQGDFAKKIGEERAVRKLASYSHLTAIELTAAP